MTTKMDTACRAVSNIRLTGAEVHAAARDEQQLAALCIAVKQASIVMYLLKNLYTLYLKGGHLSTQENTQKSYPSLSGNCADRTSR